MNLEQTERLLEQLHGQLDNAIEKGDRDTARYLYGQKKWENAFSQPC